MDNGVLTSVLNEIYAACGANGNILDNAKSLLFPLITIDFVLAALMSVFGLASADYLSLVFSKIMKYGFWIWVVDNWASLTSTLIKSLTIAGASFGTLDPGILKRPSEIIDKGFTYSVKYYDGMSELSLVGGNSLAKNIFIWIICVIAMLGILAAFAYIALNALITYIEFYIVSALMLLFIPFAALDKTAKFAENAFGFVFGTGVKLMMMGAILSLCINISDNHLKQAPVLTDDNAWAVALSSLVLAWVFAFLSVHVPELASGAMSGSPSMTGNMATSSMAGAMSGGIAGAVASKAMGAGSKGSNMAAKAAGAFSQGTGGNMGSAMRQGASAVASAFQGDFKSAASFGRGAAQSAASGIGGGLKSMAKGGTNMATSGLQDSYDMGQGAAQRKFGNYHPNSRGLGSDKDPAIKTQSASGNYSKAGASADANKYDI